MASASGKVFGIHELLEMILLHLPMRELLLAQRVCKVYRETIKESRKLQQALFFVPIQTTRTPHPVNTSLNLLLKPLFNSRFMNKYFPNAKICPNGKLSLPAAWEYPEASWQAMLPTHPASRSIDIDVYIREPGHALVSRKGCVTRDEGVTAKDVIDWVKTQREQVTLERRSLRIKRLHVKNVEPPPKVFGRYAMMDSIFRRYTEMVAGAL